jgi:polyisoprenoid-binding protein YceI
MKQLLAITAVVLLSACSPQADKAAATSDSAAIVPMSTDLPAGAYKLDRAHASLIFKVDHLGFSHYTARFKKFDADLQFDPKTPSNSSVVATVDANSLETDYPDPATLDFNAQIRSEEFLDTAKYPEMTFRSTKIRLTRPNAAQITGDFTLHGVTHPVVLDAVFNGGWKGIEQDPHARIGFSAQGSLKRSDYGIAFGIPAPGTKLGVGDEVTIIIEAEFSGPPMQPVPQAD